jgi:hypothetical protein
VGSVAGIARHRYALFSASSTAQMEPEGLTSILHVDAQCRNRGIRFNGCVLWFLVDKSLRLVRFGTVAIACATLKLLLLYPHPSAFLLLLATLYCRQAQVQDYYQGTSEPGIFSIRRIDKGAHKDSGHAVEQLWPLVPDSYSLLSCRWGSSTQSSILSWHGIPQRWTGTPGTTATSGMCGAAHSLRQKPVPQVSSHGDCR